MNSKIDKILKLLSENAETGNLCFSLYKDLIEMVSELKVA